MAERDLNSDAMEAISSRDAGALKRLFFEGLDPNAEPAGGNYTLLCWAAVRVSLDKNNGIKLSEALKVAEELLRAGADPMSGTRKAKSAMRLAKAFDLPELVELFQKYIDLRNANQEASKSSKRSALLAEVAVSNRMASKADPDMLKMARKSITGSTGANPRAGALKPRNVVMLRR